MQTEPFDVDLVLNERQINAAGKSIKDIKKRLHEAELYLNVEPDVENEPGEWESWKKRVDKLITSKESLPFPKRDDISEEVEAKVALERRTFDRTLPKETKTHDSWENRLKYLREKQQKGPCKFFGLAAEGEELKTIKPHTGINSSFGEARTLVRKDPRPGLFSERSSLPGWLGPGYYSHVDPEEGFNAPHSLSSVPFKATARSTKMTAEDLRMSKRERAKRVATASLSKSHSRLSTLSAYERKAVDEPPTELRETNPYSKFSTSSTMLIRNPLSQGDSPKRVFLGKLSSAIINHTVSHRGPKLVDDGDEDDDVLYDDGEEEITYFNKANRLKEDRGTEFAAHGIDSLLNKYEKAGSSGYKYKDFTLGALTLQVKVDPHKYEEFDRDHGNDDFPNVRTSKRGRKLPITDGNRGLGSLSTLASAASLNTSRSFASKIYGEQKQSSGLAQYHAHRSSATKSSSGAAADFDISDVKMKDGKRKEKKGDEEHSSVPRFMADKRSNHAKIDTISLSSISRSKKKAAALADPSNHMKKELTTKTASSLTHTLPTNSLSTLTLDTSSMLTEDESAVAEGVTRRILSSPLKTDIRPQIREWYAVRDVYSPPRPQTTTYLKEYKPLPVVGVDGILIGDRSGKTRDETRAEAALLSEHSVFAATLNDDTVNRLFDEEQQRQTCELHALDSDRTGSSIDRREVVVP
jgi:hypothetical protein